MGEHLYFAEWDGPYEPGITDAATAAARWVGAAGVAQQRYTEGVQSTAKDPTALAVNAQAKMRQNVVASIDSGRWARGLQSVGKAGWQAAAVAKAGNYSTGISASEQKYLQAIGPVLQIEASLQQQIAAMPNVTLQDSINRMAAWATGLHNWALTR